MAVLAVQSIPKHGSLNPVAFVAAQGGGDEVPNTGDVVLIVRNDGGGPITVTITSVPDPFGRSVNDVKVVAAGDEAVFGPWLPGIWNAADGNVDVGYSGVGSVTVAAIKIPNVKQ